MLAPLISKSSVYVQPHCSKAAATSSEHSLSLQGPEAELLTAGYNTPILQPTPFHHVVSLGTSLSLSLSLSLISPCVLQQFKFTATVGCPTMHVTRIRVMDKLTVPFWDSIGDIKAETERFAHMADDDDIDCPQTRIRVNEVGVGRMLDEERGGMGMIGCTIHGSVILMTPSYNSEPSLRHLDRANACMRLALLHAKVISKRGRRVPPLAATSQTLIPRLCSSA